MAKTPHLKLPFLAPAQAQKHVTVNESLDAIDAIAQCAVLGRDRNDPPTDAAEGDRWLIGAAPTGAWAYEAGKLAWWSNGGWAFVAPAPGWRVYDLSDDTLRVLTAAMIWTPVGGDAGPAPDPDLQNIERLGIGAFADAGNPFTAKLNSGLWTARTPAEGGSGDLFLTLNKSDATRDAGYVFQTGFVTRALAGLFGSNRFRIAVSGDGSTFRDALTVHEASGIVDQPQLPRFKAHINYNHLVAVDVWAKVGLNIADINDQNAFNPATSLFTAPVAGSYLLGASIVYRILSSSTARIRGRMVVNGSGVISGSAIEAAYGHTSEATSLNWQTIVALAAGDTVELQGASRNAACYFASGQTTFYGFKIG